tara:strand:- start:1235 stop:1888 length:654 start_codon:yes stop_codon:yes gene_type:complete
LKPNTVSLISITPKAEATIAYCARVSNPSNQDNPEIEKLLRYLINHQHWSPFELAHIVLEINTTRSIAAQILRHRSFSFQEFSQRYAAVEDFASYPNLRRQDHKNRQNSIDDLDPFVLQQFQTRAQILFQKSKQLYQEMLGAGVAKESAREVLPLATPTRLYMSGTVRSWIHYVELRSGNGTQLEHREVALAAKAVISEHLPAVAKAVWSEQNDINF